MSKLFTGLITVVLPRQYVFLIAVTTPNAIVRFQLSVPLAMLFSLLSPLLFAYDALYPVLSTTILADASSSVHLAVSHALATYFPSDLSRTLTI